MTKRKINNEGNLNGRSCIYIQFPKNTEEKNNKKAKAYIYLKQSRTIMSDIENVN